MRQLLGRKSIDFIARVCLSAVFIVAIPPKIINFSSGVDAIARRGIPQPLALFLLVAAIACLVVGSALLIFGKNQILGASLLLIFIVPTTIIFHLFPFQAKAVFMNLGLIGGLILALTRTSLIDGD
ncbi:MAG TPA: DoxX family protein [Prochlorococcus sp.]|tara:strand:+ start:493 stop:870 length:378 start_codon:yes stop_codon:yes gene_type:complete